MEQTKLETKKAGRAGLQFQEGKGKINENSAKKAPDNQKGGENSL